METHTQREERDHKVVGSSGGNTVAPAVVFHWCLERVAVLLFLSESERGVCGHMINTPRYSEVDEPSSASKTLEKAQFSFGQVF